MAQQSYSWVNWASRSYLPSLAEPGQFLGERPAPQGAEPGAAPTPIPEPCVPSLTVPGRAVGSPASGRHHDAGLLRTFAILVGFETFRNVTQRLQK